MLSSAVQCSLSEDGLLKDSTQKPELTVKSAVPASTEIECAMDESDTESVCSECSSGDEWLVF